ncbi:MAG: hypothetical protein SF162_10290 [bacterium]|nr:hypothetical protein [bacterium]
MIDHFLEQAILTIDNTPIREWTGPLYIRRNFCFALWYLAYRPNSNPVDKHYVFQDQILRIIGDGYVDDVRELLSTDLRPYVQEVIIDGRVCYAISPDDLTKIHFVLDKYYQVGRDRLPYLSISSQSYVSALYRTDSNVKQLIMNALNRVFNESPMGRLVRITPGPEESLFLEYEQPGEKPWLSLIFVHPHERALNTDEMLRACGRINNVRSDFMRNRTTDVIDLPVLLIAPPGANFQAFRTPNNNPYTYHLTPLSSQRFFQKLEKDIFDVGFNAADVAAVFPAIFPFAKGADSPLSELKAIARLQEAVQKKTSAS